MCFGGEVAYAGVGTSRWFGRVAPPALRGPLSRIAVRVVGWSFVSCSLAVLPATRCSCTNTVVQLVSVTSFAGSCRWVASRLRTHDSQAPLLCLLSICASWFFYGGWFVSSLCVWEDSGSAAVMGTTVSGLIEVSARHTVCHRIGSKGSLCRPDAEAVEEEGPEQEVAKMPFCGTQCQVAFLRVRFGVGNLPAVSAGCPSRQIQLPLCKSGGFCVVI